MKILVVEDEESLARGLKFNFEQEGYAVVTAGDGPQALEHFKKAEPPFDIIVLDLMLPSMSGYEIARVIREIDPAVPILVLSARRLSEDRTLAFDAGTDQYLTKPFALPELLSRVRNLVERRRILTAAANPSPVEAKLPAPSQFAFGNVQVDFGRFELQVGETRHSLTTMEAQLLRYFIEHEGQVLSRRQILEEVWKDDQADLGSRTIDNFVLRLRKMIEADPAEPRHLLSIRGTGYRFVS